MKKIGYVVRPYIHQSGRVMVRVRWNNKKYETSFSAECSADPDKWNKDASRAKINTTHVVKGVTYSAKVETKAEQSQNGGSGNISATQNESAEGVKKTNFMEGVEDVMLSKGTKAALAYAKDCAEAGDSDAAFFLAETYAKGNVCPKNYEKAAKYLSLAAEMDNPEALVRLGAIGYMFSVTEEGQAQVFDAFHRAALQGHPEAEMVLSCLYHTGYGCKRNEKLADMWGLKANIDKFDEDAVLTLMGIKKPSAT